MYKIALRSKEKLENEIYNLDKRIKNLPEGKLICTKNGKYCKWYNGRKYIPKAKEAFAKRLAEKRFLSARKKDLERELKAVNLYLDHHSERMAETENLLKNDEITKLLHDQIEPENDFLYSWKHAKYPKNTNYPEYLNCKTMTGDMVRSKSEAIIYNMLTMYKIPFRYECRVELGGKAWYPDFTILNPRTRKIMYWEHLGRMDSPNYRKNNFFKLEEYASHGIIENVNLIITCETKDEPLDSARVENEIKFYFEN